MVADVVWSFVGQDVFTEIAISHSVIDVRIRIGSHECLTVSSDMEKIHAEEIRSLAQPFIRITLFVIRTDAEFY